MPENATVEGKILQLAMAFGQGAGVMLATEQALLVALDAYRESVNTRARDWTPLYMSPEAIAGGKPDVGFDLWGLAVTLFEATAGMNPFVAGDRLETARLISHGILPDIRSLRADCPVRFATFLHDSLSVNRLQRPRSAREFGSRLRAADVRVGA
jgi:serine/threonine protein kinase